ncbi:MAG: transposase [Chromatiales bacterium]|nr:MAG: transposase [Chromatiales bacterium]
MAYTLSNWEALVRYAKDGDLEIDNNGAERSLRGVAVGRRNWTFFGSDNGDRTAAVLSSLIATSKRHHIDPFAYLRDVFARIGALQQFGQSVAVEDVVTQHQAARPAIQELAANDEGLR